MVHCIKKERRCKLQTFTLYTMQILLTLLAGMVSLMGLDFVWLGLLMGNTYKAEVGTLMKASPNWPAALAVYVAISAALYFFVLPKASTLSQALLWGALFGLLTYSLYDFTNLALIKDWTLKITLLDIAWGALLCGAASVVMQWVFKHL